MLLTKVFYMASDWLTTVVPANQKSGLKSNFANWYGLKTWTFFRRQASWFSRSRSIFYHTSRLCSESEGAINSCHDCYGNQFSAIIPDIQSHKRNILQFLWRRICVMPLLTLIKVPFVSRELQKVTYNLTCDVRLVRGRKLCSMLKYCAWQPRHLSYQL